MRERPIPFRDEMVRAILKGRKTQTRRVVDFHRIAKQTGCTRGTLAFSRVWDSWAVLGGDGPANVCAFSAPYVIGDRLWVREAWNIDLLSSVTQEGRTNACYELTYRAGGLEREVVYSGLIEDDPYVGLYDSQRGAWRPSIHMPRWASRITLEITDVRVQRLRDIDSADAQAEGFGADAPLIPFVQMWERIYGNRDAYSYAANPWVWAISFKQLEACHA